MPKHGGSPRQVRPVLDQLEERYLLRGPFLSTAVLPPTPEPASKPSTPVIYHDPSQADAGAQRVAIALPSDHDEDDRRRANRSPSSTTFFSLPTVGIPPSTGVLESTQENGAFAWKPGRVVQLGHAHVPLSIPNEDMDEDLSLTSAEVGSNRPTRVDPSGRPGRSAFAVVDPVDLPEDDQQTAFVPEASPRGAGPVIEAPAVDAASLGEALDRLIDHWHGLGRRLKRARVSGGLLSEALVVVAALTTLELARRWVRTPKGGYDTDEDADLVIRFGRNHLRLARR